MACMTFTGWKNILKNLRAPCVQREIAGLSRFLTKRLFIRLYTDRPTSETFERSGSFQSIPVLKSMN